jgi:DNA helicase-2/ATP-dependent DNA helicase PcrA
MRRIASADANLLVIGDPDQAIYGFRGADASAFARFVRDYPSAKAFALTRNYRSSGTIVTAASQLIARTRKNPPLADFVRDMHEKIAIHAAPTERAEAEFVVATIEKLIGGHSFFSIDSGRAADGEARDLAFCDIAVLYRTEAQSAVLVEALKRSGMPFKTSGQARLAESAFLAEGAEGDHARSLEAVALANDVDIFDARADRIALLTMHAAKGLEFPVVFIVGLEDGLAPLTFGAADEDSLAEERRLFYVAMTRAQDLLFLSRAEQRLFRGRLRQLAASPFLADIEAELVRQQRAELPRRKPERAQLALF